MRYALLLVLLAGCAEIREVRDDARISRYTETCKRNGYQPDTPEMRECVTKLLAARESR